MWINSESHSASRLPAVRHSLIPLAIVKFFLGKAPASVTDCALKEEIAVMILMQLKSGPVFHVRYNVALYVFVGINVNSDCQIAQCGQVANHAY